MKLLESLVIIRFLFRYKLIFSEAFDLSLKKFGIKLFEAVQYFDPKFIQSSVRRRDKIIPEFLYPSDHLITEWGIYCELKDVFDDFDLEVY